MIVVELIFGLITLSAVVLATFESSIRRAILALWVAGLGIGALYLIHGVEFLAIIQWIVSTLVAITFIFFAVMFGEYHSPKIRHKKENRYFYTGASLFIGLVFTGLVWFGSHDLPTSFHSYSSAMSDLKVIGKTLTQDHLLSLEVLALMLFLVLIGGGVISRSEGGDP